VFWAAEDAIDFWMSRKGDMAENNSDNSVESGLIPIVLRRRGDLFSESDLHEDKAGSKDSSSDAYYTEGIIPAQELEVWDGSWTPVADADPEAMTEEVYDDADKEFIDGEELVYANLDYFLP